MAQSEKDIYVKNIFSSIAPYIDFLNRLFSLGQDMRWRKTLVARSGIKSGDTVLDICTGTGDLAFLISEKIGPTGSVTGIDFCKEMLDIALKRMNRHHENMLFIQSDARYLHFPDNTFDAVTVAFGIRNISDTHIALKEIKRVLKPGGTFSCLELTRPTNRLFLPVYNLYTFKVMPFIARLISKTERPYTYLPRSIDAFHKHEDFKRILAECGFSDITINSLSLGTVTIYRAANKT